MIRLIVKNLAVICLLISWAPAKSEAADSLIMGNRGFFPGQSGEVPVYLHNSSFRVGGIALRIILNDSAFVSFGGAVRGSGISHFEYFDANFNAGICKIATVYNWPGGGDPSPLDTGYNEIARIMIRVDSLAPLELLDSLFFRNDTIPPDRDNSISDETGYINLVPIMSSGFIEVLSPTAIDNEQLQTPAHATLSQNYPNPFNAETRLGFSLSRPARDVELRVLDILGRSVRTFEFGDLNAGEYTVIWNGKDHNGSDVSSGIYFYKFSSSQSETQVKRMTLLK